MKYMTSEEIREAFLNFFSDKGHQVVASSSVVPGNDPTLLFTNAGMVQFKDVFLGQDKRPYKRATTSQKCIRISGKHNDLENVGPSPRHHTFFEMLGNFSFGDYFKRDAIVFAYTLLTEVYQLPADRLAFTVYETDDDAYDIWTQVVGVSPSRVARMGPKTNFWQMADTGPCGPTSEIHWDLKPELGEDGIIDALMREDDRFLELWNLVFMQFNRTQADPKHTGEFDVPLPAPGVDTGLGLERIVAVMQDVASNYDTDIYTDVMDATQDILGHDDEFRAEHYVAYRVIADHMRAASFLIADGVNPGTTGREYVPRMLIRRALRFAHSMGVDRPFMTDVTEAVINKLGDVYPELRQFREAIRYQISTEEGRFLRTLDSSLGVLQSMIADMKAEGSTKMDGQSAFNLYQTNGLPLEITRDLLQENSMEVDEAGFQTALGEHREKSSSETTGFEDISVYSEVLRSLISQGKLSPEGVTYDPYNYNALRFSSEVLALIHDGQVVTTAHQSQHVEVVLTNTAFYVESGGQVSDTGALSGSDWSVSVDGMRKPVGGLIVHAGVVTNGVVSVGDYATGQVDTRRRWDIMRNHTATHLLHASLRNVLGEHVRQKGSLVAPDRLRFDFTHNTAITDRELSELTDQVSEMILNNIPLDIVNKSLEEARREGAMALFGEKYGEYVRTITISEPEQQDRYSYELCGGTHVRTTAEIGPFVITREESSSAGVRRIEAVTGTGAYELIRERMNELKLVADRLHTQPGLVLSNIEGLVGTLEDLQNKIDGLERQTAQDSLETLLYNPETVHDFEVIAAQVDAPDGDLLAEMADWCRDRLTSGVVLLGADIDGKVRLVAKVTPDLVKRGVHAGKLVGEVARLVGGGGGGRPDFATAGGKDTSRIKEAVSTAASVISGMVQ